VDDLDRRIAAALQVNGRATWRQVAHAVGSSESTVARRAQQLIDGGFMRVTGVADPIRCGFGYPVLVQLKCEVGTAGEAAELLAERPDVRFVALVTGTFDLVAELIVPSRRRLARVLLEELPEVRGITETTTESVLRNFKTAYDWSRDLLGDTAAELEPPAGSDGQPIVLNGVDLQLLQLLVEDGRRSFAQLAGALGISESMARRRVDALTASGCLRFATFVDPHQLGYDVEVFVWMQVDLARLEETALALAARPEVRYLSATSGFSDLICEVILRSQDDLYAFSTETLGALTAVRQVDFALELATVKRGYFRAGDYVSKEER
jgi:DNA-binding Lrp family transcriptional regulator